MEQFGEVIAVEDKMAIVKVRRHSACRQCGRCGMGITGGEAPDPVVEVKNPIGARVGQVVKITMESKQLLFISFIVYFLPILALILGIVLGMAFTDAFGLASEGRLGDIISVTLGLFLMIATFFFIRGWDRRVAGTSKMKPVAVDIVEEEE